MITVGAEETMVAKVLTKEGHRCLICRKTFPSPRSLKRHQSIDSTCRYAEEMSRFRIEGFDVGTYADKYIARGKRWIKLDPPVLVVAKTLGVEWFESPTTNKYFYVPIWYGQAWDQWPHKVRVLLVRNPEWVPRKRGDGRRKVYVTKTVLVPTAGFDAEIAAALRDEKVLHKLKMRLAVDAMHLYATSSA